MPRAYNTKDLILDAALILFSDCGYDGVGIRDIAREVGIRESALYKHFNGKQAIFDCLVERMNAEYDGFARSIGAGERAEEMSRMYQTISEDALLEIGKGFFLYFTQNEKAVRFRKILTMEQYRNEAIGALYRSLYFENVLAYNAVIFKGLIENGVMIQADPDIAALHFYAPIFLLLTSFDEQKLTTPAALERLENHIKQFRKMYYRG